MPTAADQTLDLDPLTGGLTKAITTTDNAVSLFNFPAGTRTISLLITGNPATLLFSQASTLINGLSRPAVNTMSRLDIPAVPATWEGTPGDFGVSGASAFKLGICTTTDGSNATIQASVGA